MVPTQKKNGINTNWLSLSPLDYLHFHLSLQRRVPGDISEPRPEVTLPSTGNKVPQDRTIVMMTLRTVSLTLFVLMCCLSLLGLVVAVGLLCFNYIYRERR